jgi:hypothetical protein
LAEIEAFQNYEVKGNTFSFSSFYELYKCAIEHVFGYNSYNGICNKYIICNKCFRHIFGSIRAILAELEAFQILTLNKELANYSANPLFLIYCKNSENSESYITLYEPDKCVDSLFSFGGLNLLILRAILAEVETFQIFTRNKEAANCDAGPLSLSFEQIFQFNPKDGSTIASTNNGKNFILSEIHLLISTHLEKINIIFIKVPTDKCNEHRFNSIRTRMTKLEPIEELELLYTSKMKDIAIVRVSEANASEDPHASALAPDVAHANDNANANTNGLRKNY